MTDDNDVEAGPLAVNPDGSPGHVVSGELVESSWGNSVSDEFQRVPRVQAGSAAAPTWGGAVPAGSRPIIKAGVFGGTSSAAGQITVAYAGGAFPGGVVAVHVMPVSGAHYMSIAGQGAITTASVLVYCFGPGGAVVASGGIDAVYIAIGW